jgi:hypothetical protein
MRKKHAIYLAIALAVIGGTLALRLWPRTVPPEDCSELYRLYADTPGVDATFIRGFQVNDTLSLDVTLLQATDSAGWETLITDFQVTREFINLKFDNIISRWGKKGHADKQQDSIPENNDLILVANRMRTISIFHITDKSQFKQIIRIHVKELKDK